MRVVIDPENLRRELGRRGLSQSEFSRICGVSEPVVSHAACGRFISGQTLEKMARGLAITPILAGVDALLGSAR